MVTALRRRNLANILRSVAAKRSQQRCQGQRTEADDGRAQRLGGTLKQQLVQRGTWVLRQKSGALMTDRSQISTHGGDRRTERGQAQRAGQWQSCGAGGRRVACAGK